MNCLSPLLLAVCLAFSVPPVASQPNQHGGIQIKNPDIPLNPEAGRSLVLEEIFRITDEGGEFFFKHPRDIRIGPEGTIYIADEEQLLKFTPEGGFIKNLYKRGQGPGEIQGYFQFAVSGDRIYVYDHRPAKLICFKLGGELIEEIRFQERPGDFYGLLAGNFVFLQNSWPPMKVRTKESFPVGHRICLVGKDGTRLLEGENFSTQARVLPGGGVGYSPIRTARNPDGRRFYFTGSEDYLVEVIELDQGSVIQRLTRKYQRVRRSPGKKKPGLPSGLSSGIYINDIGRIVAAGDSLWVATSTRDPEKGILYDVFDGDGRYSDSFYIDMRGGGWVEMVLRTYLFMIEIDENGIYSVVKYRFR
jgi:hypothetical protein